MFSLSRRYVAVGLVAAAAATALASTRSFVLPTGGRLPQHEVAPSSQEAHTSWRDLSRTALPEASTTVEATALPESDSVLSQAIRWLLAGVAAGILGATFSTDSVEAYNTPIIGKASWEHDVVKGSLNISTNRNKLEPCSKNKRFAKRVKDSLYKLQQRQNKYPEGSVVYNRFVEKAALVKRRQNAYGDRLCGKKDGTPRVMADSTVKGGLTIATVMFLYTAGWIGWAGRSYLLKTHSIEKEFIIDAPLALTCMASGFAWPVLGWQAIANGEMVEKEENLYRQPF